MENQQGNNQNLGNQNFDQDKKQPVSNPSQDNQEKNFSGQTGQKGSGQDQNRTNIGSGQSGSGANRQ